MLFKILWTVPLTHISFDVYWFYRYDIRLW